MHFISPRLPIFLFHDEHLRTSIFWDPEFLLQAILSETEMASCHCAASRHVEIPVLQAITSGVALVLIEIDEPFVRLSRALN